MLLNLVLVLAAMFWLSWQLSLVALVVVPLFVLPGKVAVGAGKTTITHLVPRLYDPARRAVWIGGHDVRSL